MSKNQIDRCERNVIHQNIVDAVSGRMPDDTMIYNLAEFFKAFGDLTRIRILWALSESEMCVCDISALLNMTPSSISHQLRVLKQARLVKFRKAGKVVYYHLDDIHIRQVFDQGWQHIKERQ